LERPSDAALDHACRVAGRDRRARRDSGAADDDWGLEPPAPAPSRAQLLRQRLRAYGYYRERPRYYRERRYYYYEPAPTYYYPPPAYYYPRPRYEPSFSFGLTVPIH